MLAQVFVSSSSFQMKQISPDFLLEGLVTMLDYGTKYWTLDGFHVFLPDLHSPALNKVLPEWVLQTFQILLRDGFPELSLWAGGWILISWAWRQHLENEENEEMFFLKFPWD